MSFFITHFPSLAADMLVLVTLYALRWTANTNLKLKAQAWIFSCAIFQAASAKQFVVRHFGRVHYRRPG
jgi:hypothetical protein